MTVLRCTLARLVAIAVLGTCAAAAARAQPGLQPGLKMVVDLFCGPRCVAFVAKHFGKQESLVEVIRDMQGKDLDKGSTMAEIGDALLKRGIHSRAVQMDGPFQIRWNHPVIVHFPGDGKRLGHFAVWQPNQSDRSGELVWMGLDGNLRIDATEFSMTATNIVLLTAPSEIKDSDLAGLQAPLSSWWIITASGIVIILALGVCLLVRARAKRAVAKG